MIENQMRDLRLRSVSLDALHRIADMLSAIRSGGV